MGMTIDELKCIIGEYKLRIPPTVYYELLTDLEDAEFITKDQYEARLKADMVAMLEELKEQLREMHEDFFETEHFDEAYGVSNSMDIIQEKINALRADRSEEENG